MAQLVEWWLSTPEIRGSNPVIIKCTENLLTMMCIEKTKIMKKGPGMAHLKRRGEKELR